MVAPGTPTRRTRSRTATVLIKPEDVPTRKTEKDDRKAEEPPHTTRTQTPEGRDKLERTFNFQSLLNAFKYIESGVESATPKEIFKRFRIDDCESTQSDFGNKEEELRRREMEERNKKEEEDEKNQREIAEHSYARETNYLQEQMRIADLEYSKKMEMLKESYNRMELRYYGNVLHQRYEEMIGELKSKKNLLDYQYSARILELDVWRKRIDESKEVLRSSCNPLGLDSLNEAERKNLTPAAATALSRREGRRRTVSFIEQPEFLS